MMMNIINLWKHFEERFLSPRCHHASDTKRPSPFNPQVITLRFHHKLSFKFVHFPMKNRKILQQ